MRLYTGQARGAPSHFESEIEGLRLCKWLSDHQLSVCRVADPLLGMLKDIGLIEAPPLVIELSVMLSLLPHMQHDSLL